MKLYRILSIIIVIIWASKNSLFTVDFGNFYFLLFTGILLVYLPSKSLRVDIAGLLLIVTCLISIVANNIPEYFQAELRFLGFITINFLVGPFVSNNKLIKLRQEIFSLINPAILQLVILSTITLFLRLPFAFGYSGFFGIFNHSMFLGPMASISCLYSITKYHTSKNTLFLVAGIFSMVTCIAAGSRAALGGLFIGLLYLIFILYKRKLSTYIKVVLSIFLLILLSKPIWQPYTATLENKIVQSNARGSITSSRDNLWEVRINEFLSSPFYGIGFATVDPHLDHRHDTKTGGIEPGSSWLAILSMTGLMGLLGMIILIYKRFILTMKHGYHNDTLAFKGGVLIFFMIHFLAEGYVYSAGSGLFFYFWLLLGVMNPRNI